MTEHITNIIFRIALLMCLIYTVWQLCILWKCIKSLRKPKVVNAIIQHPIRSVEVERYCIAVTQRRIDEIKFLNSDDGFQAASEVSSLCNQLGIKMETDLCDEDDEEILN